MSIVVENLGKSDFEPAMQLLDRAFAEHGVADFASLHPALYQPTPAYMARHLGVREGRRLVAMLGVYPIDWRLGDRTLPVAGIGGVAVDPDARGRGLMRLLMDRARATIATRGDPLGYLGGQRQRYRRFGWEASGVRLRLELSAKNLAAIVARAPAVTLAPSTPADHAELAALHGAQSFRCARPDERFAAHLRTWRHESLVARLGERIVGYLVVAARERWITELVAPGPDLAVELLRAHVRDARSWSVLLPNVPTALLSRLAAEAESVVVEQNGNWWVRDWVRVVGELLAYRHAVRPLLPGEVVLRCAEQTFRLRVDGTGAGAAPSAAPPSLSLDAPTLTRLLFGPLPPAAVVRLPAAAGVLAAWCPLPLALPVQDQV